MPIGALLNVNNFQLLIAVLKFIVQCRIDQRCGLFSTEYGPVGVQQQSPMFRYQGKEATMSSILAPT